MICHGPDKKVSFIQKTQILCLFTNGSFIFLSILETHTSFLPVRPVLLGFSCTQWINTYRENRMPRVCVHDGLLWDERRCIYSVTPGSRDITVSWRKGELGWGWGAAQGAWRCYLPHLPSHGFWQGRVWSPGIHLGAFLSSLSFLSSLQTVSFTFQTGWESLLVVSSSLSPVRGQGPQRLRPRGGTSQVGKECRSLVLLLESLLPQPGLDNQFWDISETSSHIFLPLDPRMYVY